MAQYVQPKPVTQRIHLIGTIVNGLIIDEGAPRNSKDVQAIADMACEMANYILAKVTEDGKRFREEMEDRRGNRRDED